MMLHDPFTILRPFTDQLSTVMFTKEDDVKGDQPAGKILGTKKTAGVHQVHGNRVIIVRDALNRTEKADGMITDQKGLALCIRWADCQNFVIFCSQPRVVGVLHAGWRGIEAKAITSFFSVLQKEWRIDPHHLYVAAGPSLCTRCAGFTDPLRELPSLDRTFIHENTIDLQGAATAEFLHNGILPEHIERHPDCTRCHPELYWTYRGGHREEVKTGHTNMLACALV